jgi:hypothetical protein
MPCDRVLTVGEIGGEPTYARPDRGGASAGRYRKLTESFGSSKRKAEECVQTLVGWEILLNPEALAHVEL